MSVKRLRRIAANAVAKPPDLIFLTGDFLTMESQSDPELLRRALEPLRGMPGQVFACFGNHDHEAEETVRERARRERRHAPRRRGAVRRDRGRSRCRSSGWTSSGAIGRRTWSASASEHPRRPGVTRDRPAARPGRVPAPTGGRGRPRALGSHARRAGGSRELRSLVDVPAPLRDCGCPTTGSGRAGATACTSTGGRVTTASRSASASRPRRAFCACIALRPRDEPQETAPA